MNMRIIKAIIATITVVLFVAPVCQSQNIQYSNGLRPKVLMKLDSLYPHAIGRVIFNDRYVSNSTQEIQINCHCDEAVGMMILVFDTNGRLENKDIYFNSLNSLPDTILHYMKKNTSKTVTFNFNHMTKSINNKGEVSYYIDMWESPGYWSRTDYRLRFRSDGELISKENIDASR
jgi:hypothetical protein